MDENGYKFELFSYDAFPITKPENFGLVEAIKDQEYAPIINAPGSLEDSPEIARDLLALLHQKWLETKGVMFDSKGIIRRFD